MKSILEEVLVIDVDSLKGCKRAGEGVEKRHINIAWGNFAKNPVYFIDNNLKYY